MAHSKREVAIDLVIFELFEKGPNPLRNSSTLVASLIVQNGDQSQKEKFNQNLTKAFTGEWGDRCALDPSLHVLIGSDLKSINPMILRV